MHGGFGCSTLIELPVKCITGDMLQALVENAKCSKTKQTRSVTPCVHVCAGEIFFIGYQVDKQPPGVHYGGADKDGKLQFDVKVELKEVRVACCAQPEGAASSALVYCGSP